MNGLLAGALLLGVLILRDRKFAKPERRWAWQLLWPLSVISLYWLVHAEPRFVAPFFVLLWFAVYGVLMARVAATPRKVILASVAATVLIPSLFMACITFRSLIEE